MLDEAKIVTDPVFGYKRLDPVPSAEELDQFYAKRYFDLIRTGERARDMRARVLAGLGQSPDVAWLESTLYADIREVLGREAPGRRCLDVGSGTGDLLHSLVRSGFDAVGVEPDRETARALNEAGLEVHGEMFEAYAAAALARPGERFDAVLFKHVLELVRDPVEWVRLGAELLSPGGVLFVQVGNDFSEFQAAAVRLLGARQWWVAYPDHINYFDRASLGRVLEHHGLQVLHAQATFPMELFLLFGENYVEDSELGSRCHSRRKSFELAISPDLRRRLYRGFAELGIGRDCVVFAKKPR
jgi:2-polyprenyl-3-methyl-5-hydroxy-6-metoxy-1,4-benzoquinol methylase